MLKTVTDASGARHATSHIVVTFEGVEEATGTINDSGAPWTFSDIHTAASSPRPRQQILLHRIDKINFTVNANNELTAPPRLAQKHGGFGMLMTPYTLSFFEQLSYNRRGTGYIIRHGMALCIEYVPRFGEEIMSQSAVKRLYLMQVGSMPEYQVPIVCYLVQTDDGKNILIDSGLPDIIPEEQREFAHGHMLIDQLTTIGLQPDDIDMVISTHYDFDHSGNHGAFTKAGYIVQRAHHEHAPGNARFAITRPQWDQPMERIRLVDGDTELLAGLAVIESSGHVPGHQSVLVRLPKTGAVLLTVDAVPFREGFVRDLADEGGNPDAEATRASTNKLLDLVERERVGLVIFGHDPEQWEGLKKLPGYYE